METPENKRSPRKADLGVDGRFSGARHWALGQFLCPTLQPAETVILDNLSSHKVAGVAEAITVIGAIVLFLPPYSPDLNPIEEYISKLKARPLKAAQRDVDALWKEIWELLNTASPSECRNFLTSCGYVST